MAQTRPTDVDVSSRAEFEKLLSRLLVAARSNDVEVEGAYNAWSDSGENLRVDIAEVVDGSRDGAFESVHGTATDGRASGAATSRVSLVQVLTGLPLEDQEGTAFCRECLGGITEGDIVTVYCRKPVDGHRWDVHKVYCRECGVTALRSPSYGQTGVLVEATVAEAMDSSDQSSRQVLNNVRLFDYSAASDGAI